MFIRTKTTPNSSKKSVQIVESYRKDGFIRQRILRHVGVAEDAEQLSKLKELAAFMLAEMHKNIQLSLLSADEQAQQLIQAHDQQSTTLTLPALKVDLRQLREVSRITIGFHEVYGQIYQQLGFDKLMGARRVASGRVLRDMVMARLARPASKLASTQFLQRDFGIEIDTDQVYRMMDHLDEPMQTKLQQLAREAAFGLLQQKVDVLFFDCTTLYFESFDEDDLRQKGFSKDHKSAETQVLLALMVTREGLPVGYRLYPGSQWEGHTLINALQDLRTLAQVERIVLVADSALFNKENIELLESHRQSYIVAAQLKKLPQATQELLFNRSRYQPLTEEESFIETTYRGQRLIVTYSAQRAKKDAHERNKAVEKAKKLFDNKTVKSAIKGYHARYLKVEGKGRVQIDDDRIKKAAQWEGLHGVITNMKEISVQETIAHYRGLWQVEQTFRLSKHDLRIRPIFHWTPSRIRAHVALCFIALTCMRWLMYTCALRYQRLSAEVIQNELTHVQVSILEHQQDQRRFAIPSAVTKHAKQLFKLVGRTLNSVPFEIV